jgi:predicted RNA-binding protein with PUA-like domain
MAYWLVKSEASAYSWQNLVADGRTAWDGVRNFQARNNLAAMRKGDAVFFYHSVDDREVVGVARVVREAYPDAKADEEGWLAVDLEPAEALARPVSLDEIKSDSRLRDIGLVRQGRLSVMPLSAEEHRAILALSRSGCAAQPKGQKTAKASKGAKARKGSPAKRTKAKRAKAKKKT